MYKRQLVTVCMILRTRYLLLVVLGIPCDAATVQTYCCGNQQPVYRSRFPTPGDKASPRAIVALPVGSGARRRRLLWALLLHFPSQSGANTGMYCLWLLGSSIVRKGPRLSLSRFSFTHFFIHEFFRCMGWRFVEFAFRLV